MVGLIYKWEFREIFDWRCSNSIKGLKVSLGGFKLGGSGIKISWEG